MKQYLIYVISFLYNHCNSLFEVICLWDMQYIKKVVKICFDSNTCINLHFDCGLVLFDLNSSNVASKYLQINSAAV